MDLRKNNYILTDDSIVTVFSFDHSRNIKSTVFKFVSNYLKYINKDVNNDINLDAVILVYDITDRKSFDECKNFYIKEIKENCKNDTKVILLGNKTDLKERREISFKEGNNLASVNNFLFMETSCLQNRTVFEVFEKLIVSTLKVRKKSRDRKGSGMEERMKTENKPEFLAIKKKLSDPEKAEIRKKDCEFETITSKCIIIILFIILI
jgi:hypothetical protein